MGILPIPFKLRIYLLVNSNIRLNRRSDRRENGSKNLRVFGNIEWGSASGWGPSSMQRDRR